MFNENVIILMALSDGQIVFLLLGFGHPLRGNVLSYTLTQLHKWRLLFQ